LIEEGHHMDDTATGITVGDDVITRIAGTLARMLDQEQTSFRPETRLFDDLDFDSTSVLELLMQLETDLGVEFDPETLDPSDFETVGALAGYITKQLEA